MVVRREGEVDGMDPTPLLLFTGNWEVNARFPLLDTHFSFQFLALGQTVKASGPLSGRLEPPPPLCTAPLLSPSQGGSPTLTPGRDWWNHWVETDCDSTRWAGFDRVDSEQLLSGGRGREGEGGGGNPRARADP